MKRIVKPELLDGLPPDDPRAVRSRRDLCRVNTGMRNHAIMVRALQTGLNGQAPKQIVELGAGDGNFLLRVAEEMMPRYPNVNVTLLDRQKVVMPQTITSFTLLGWCAEAVTADVFDWSETGDPAEVVIANLFLHHFDDARLTELLRAIAGRARLFVAIEPRRAPWPLFCSRLLWTISCNFVTRHDAVLSVRAGFSDKELSTLWPDKPDWQLTEQRAGLFSQLFIAQRTG
jgi:hypothetical protein